MSPGVLNMDSSDERGPFSQICFFPKWTRTSEFIEFKESEKSLNHEFGSIFKDLLCCLYLHGALLAPLSLMKEVVYLHNSVAFIYLLHVLCWSLFKHIDFLRLTHISREKHFLIRRYSFSLQLK